ncbi:hypothetical protein OS242_10410 [Tumebacillus sp. DT12]|uniref:Phage protein n=1 Tax=Tumebacillus lacus TaxID=2995335 RepID=A0ABT3X0E4_9BACL|nr:hypothetical protein [Tumebacillus lacus]MCX7570376.1 hypothetical protein [Tumebacillus lacus]
MKQSFRIKQGTPAWEKFHRYHTQDDAYIANKESIEALIGCPMEKNLALYTERLYMKQPAEQYRDQFSKQPDRTGYYTAKKNSKINKAWIDFVKAKGLDSYSSTKLRFDLGLLSGRITLYPPMNGGEYYITIETKEDLDQERYDFLEPIAEASLLRIYADHLEQNGGEQE